MLILLAARTALELAEGVNVAIIICGGLCAVAFLFWLASNHRFRAPLAGVREAALWRALPGPDLDPSLQNAAADRPQVERSVGLPRPAGPESLPLPRLILGPEGPTLFHVVLALAVYLVASQLAALAFLHGYDFQAASQPGTRSWLLFQSADIVAKLLVSVLMVSMLARHPLFPLVHADRGTARKVAIGILTGLALIAVTFVQLQMGVVIWQWLHPQQELPLHPVLLALKQGDIAAGGKSLLLVAAIVTAPLAEELFFRGLLLGAIWRLTARAWVAAVVSGIAFGAIHGQPQDILPLCTMGVILGCVRLRTHSLVPTIVAHSLFNVRTIVLAVLFPETISA